MRGSDPDAAVYYLAAMLEGGEDARFIARRMVILASEDVGNADPRALLVAVAAAQALEHVGLAGGTAQPRPGGDLPRQRTEVERLGAGDLERAGRGARTRHPAAARPRFATPTTPGRAREDTARATSRPHDDPAARRRRSPPGRSRGTYLLCSLRQRRGERRWRSGRVSGHRSSTSRRRSTSRACACRTFAASATSCSSSTRSRSRPSAARRRSTCRPTCESFENAETEVIFVSCDTSAARQAWKQELGATYAFASDFWQHGAAARAYGVFNEETGAPRRGTFLIDKDGVVIWSLVKDGQAHRDGAGVARSARRAAVSRTLHVETWGDPARRGSSASTASPGTAAAPGALAEGWLARPLRARARPARPRLLAVRAALEHRRARRPAARGASARSRRSGSATRSAAGSPSRSPPAVPSSSSGSCSSTPRS